MRHDRPPEIDGLARRSRRVGSSLVGSGMGSRTFTRSLREGGCRACDALPGAAQTFSSRGPGCRVYPGARHTPAAGPARPVAAARDAAHRTVSGRGDPRHRRRRHVHGRCSARGRPSRDREGPDGARTRRSRSSRQPRRSAPAGWSGSPTARRWQRTRCSNARERARPSSPPRASSTSSISGDRPGRTSTVPVGTIHRRSCHSSSVSECASESGRDGVVLPLELDTLAGKIDAEAVAVCLLFAFRDPSHERQVADELRRRLPHATVVASHEVAPEFREYERASTTAADAYLGPVVARYLRRLAVLSAEAGLPEPLVMRSSGGVATLEEAALHPSWILVSGPAGGVVGAGLAAASGRLPERDLVRHGRHIHRCLPRCRRPRRTLDRAARRRAPDPASQRRSPHGRRRRRLDRVAIDAGGALRVGPESAGADPGPACYGRGGTRPTVTDANLLLGRLPAALPGGIVLDSRGGAARDGRARPGGGGGGRQRRDAARASGRLGRARSRPARLRAGRIRRRRAAARLCAGRTAGHRHGARARRGRRAVGARARGERRAA